jgi:tRNA U38,U39,U40 pseudouridine synthase TruA
MVNRNKQCGRTADGIHGVVNIAAIKLSCRATPHLVVQTFAQVV